MPRAAMRSAFGAKHTQDSSSKRHPKIQIIELARTANGMRSGLYGRAGVVLPTPAPVTIQTVLMTSREIVARGESL
jgi:hypothetical protein